MPRGISTRVFRREGGRIPYKTTLDTQEASTMAEQEEGRESFPKNESKGEVSNAGNSGEGQTPTSEGGEGEGRSQEGVAGQGAGQISGARGDRETSR
ncbi:MAG TPA: hypothetical protein VHU19_11680 [Pyrinomonadaceae bacterium]|nr:hypothetical protein [Pyrinomonadaceae bacterium]